MMKKQTNKPKKPYAYNANYSLLVYIKNRYKYSDSELQLQTLCEEKYDGRHVGGGTDLSTGKRDQQFMFNKEAHAKAFLRHPFTKTVALKDYDLDKVEE
jgi:hypothetical protein